MFEDGLITVTHARNAVEGVGLTSHPGEGHVQGFTSPIGALAPLLGEAVRANGGGLVAIRLASIVAAAAAIGAAHLIGREFRLNRWAMVFPLFYLALDQNQIFYGMSGMETQMAVAILLWSAYAVMRERTLLSGALLGLCILTRPDLVIWVAPAACYLVWRRRHLRALAGAFGAFTAVAAPWYLFATLYYGSPIPDTIGAKLDAYFTPPRLSAGLAQWFSFAGHQLSDHVGALLRGFMPFLESFQAARAPVPGLALVYVAFTVIGLCILGAIRLWRLPQARPLTVYVGLFLAYRVFVLPSWYYEWYLPPFMACVVLLCGGGLTAVRRRYGIVPATVPAVALALAFAMHIPFSFPLEARLQHGIEDKVRTRMALWLRAHVLPGQSVSSESAGYVSWYGRVKLYDYPGLTSPTAYRALKRLGHNHNSLSDLVRVLLPDWLVMRPSELRALKLKYSSVSSDYRIIHEWQLEPHAVSMDQWGLVYESVDTDQRFFVLRKVKKND
jgi:hypothetical protein